MSSRKVCVDITLSYTEGSDRVHYRVQGSLEEDWSGWADSEEQAIRRAKARKDDVMYRLVAEARAKTKKTKKPKAPRVTTPWGPSSVHEHRRRRQRDEENLILPPF